MGRRLCQNESESCMGYINVHGVYILPRGYNKCRRGYIYSTGGIINVDGGM